jgi:hypothetical protein
MEPDVEQPKEYLGWQLFNTHIDNNHVQGYEEHVAYATNLGTMGPHTIHFPPMAGKYMCPNDQRLEVDLEVLYKRDGVVQDNLPSTAKLVERPLEDVTDSGVELVFKAVANGQFKVPFDSTGASPQEKQGNLFIKKKTNTKQLSNVSTVSNFAQALWNNIAVSIGNYNITLKTNFTYHQQVNLAYRLSYSEATMENNLCSEHYYKDPPRKKDEVFTEAFEKRRIFTSNNPVKVVTMPYTELANIEKFMVDNLDVKFHFQRNPAEMLLDTSGGTYLINITSMKMYVKFMIPTPAIHNDIQMALERGAKASYNITRTDMVESQIPASMSQHTFNNMFANNRLPDLIYAVLVETQAKNGALTKDPFYYEHGHVSNIVLKVNGVNFPSDPYTPVFPNGNADSPNNPIVERETRALYDAIGIKMSNVPRGITREEFLKGFTVWAWDLNPDNCAGKHWNHSAKQGDCAIHLSMSKPTAYPTSLLVMGVYRDILYIDRTRTPILATVHGITPVMFDT